MHRTRSKTIKAIPLPRKGDKYVARSSRNDSNSLPLIIAVRDMLKLAGTTKEVKRMIHNKMLKINGRFVKDTRDPICLFSTLNADKNYKLTILTTGRFAFEDSKDSARPLKIVSKTAVKNKKIQYGLHDGTALISDKGFAVGDTLILDDENKLKKHIVLEKGKEVFVFSGSNIGMKGHIEAINGPKAIVKLGKEDVVLNKAQIIAI